jgi:hypothetical protein
MSAQLSLLDAVHVDLDTGDDHRWFAGEDIVADIDAVLAYVPKVGHRHGTAREKSRRPLALLYARTALLEPAERKVVQGIARAATGFLDPWDGYDGWDPEGCRGVGEIWVRVTGERDGGWGMGRQGWRSVSGSARGAAWRADFRAGAVVRPTVKAWREQVRPHLRVLGCDPGKRDHLLLPSLAPLILALRWSPALEAAVFIAGSGVAPKSDEWAVLVDQAQDRPWHEALAVLSARHPRDVLTRALGWVHAQGMSRRADR